jgi:hypothetical protein
VDGKGVLLDRTGVGGAAKEEAVEVEGIGNGNGELLLIPTGEDGKVVDVGEVDRVSGCTIVV